MGTEATLQKITYDNGNTLYGENGYYTIIGIGLVDCILVRADDYEKDEKRSSESIANYTNRENYISVERTYWK